MLIRYLTLVHISLDIQQKIAVSSAKEQIPSKAAENVFKRQEIPSGLPDISLSPLNMAQEAPPICDSQSLVQVSCVCVHTCARVCVHAH
jgi:hypothetical protein